MNSVPRLGLWLTFGFAVFGRLEASVQITRYSRQTDGFAITWTAEPGKTYTLLSAPSIAGPWDERARLTELEEHRLHG